MRWPDLHSATKLDVKNEPFTQPHWKSAASLLSLGRFAVWSAGMVKCRYQNNVSQQSSSWLGLYGGMIQHHILLSSSMSHVLCWILGVSTPLQVCHRAWFLCLNVSFFHSVCSRQNPAFNHTCYSDAAPGVDTTKEPSPPPSYQVWQTSDPPSLPPD